MSSRLQMLKDAVGYSTSAVLTQALGLVSGFVVARLLGPTDYGVWNAVSIALVYAANCDLGILPAMSRDLPYYLGQGDRQKAQELEDTTLGVTLGSSALVALILFAISVWPGHSPMMALGLCGMAVLIILQRLHNYYQTLLRCYHEFSLLSRLQAIFALLSTALIIGLVFWLHFLGRVAAAILSQLAILLVTVRLRKWSSVPRLNWTVVRQLAKVGVPIIISSAVMGLLTTMDRVMVVSFLGETQLGYFGLALLMASTITVIPTMANQVLIPRISHRYGESNNSIGALKKYVLAPPILWSLLLPLMIGSLYLALPVLVQLVLPAFAPGISAARIVVVGIYFMGIVGLADYFLLTIGRLKPYVLFGCFALSLSVTLNLLALQLGYGIEGVAISGTLITYACYATGLIGYALSFYTRKPQDWIRFFAKVFSPFIYMVFLLWGVEWLVHLPEGIDGMARVGVAGQQILLFGMGCLPLIWLASRELTSNFPSIEFSVLCVAPANQPV